MDGSCLINRPKNFSIGGVRDSGQVEEREDRETKRGGSVLFEVQIHKTFQIHKTHQLHSEKCIAEYLIWSLPTSILPDWTHLDGIMSFCNSMLCSLMFSDWSRLGTMMVKRSQVTIVRSTRSLHTTIRTATGIWSSILDVIQGVFHWYPPKKLKYGKPSLGESTLA